MSINSWWQHRNRYRKAANGIEDHDQYLLRRRGFRGALAS